MHNSYILIFSIYVFTQHTYSNQFGYKYIYFLLFKFLINYILCSIFRNIMGCEIEKKQRRWMGIGEALLGLLLLIMVFVTCGSYWTHVDDYKESYCGWRIRLYDSDEDGTGFKVTSTCLLITDKAFGEDLSQCQFFDVDGTLPNSEGVQTSVALSVVIFIGALIFRAVFHILFLYIYKDKSKNKMAKYDFWTINLMLSAMHVGMIGFIHLFYLKYTDICIESPIKDYDGDTTVTYDNTGFYIFLALAIIYNIIWYFSIIKKSCCDCCSRPQYVYWILNMVIYASIMIYIYTISKTQVGLPIVFTLYIIAYFVFVGIIIHEFKYKRMWESKKGGRIRPGYVEGGNGVAMAVAYPVQPVGYPPVYTAQPTNPPPYGAQPVYPPALPVYPPPAYAQPGYVAQPYAQPPGYAPVGQYPAHGYQGGDPARGDNAGDGGGVGGTGDIS